MRKRITALIMLIILFVSSVPVNAFALEGTDSTGSGGLIIGSIKSDIEWNGKKQITFNEDELKVYFNGKLLKPGKDYKTAYSNNKEVWELNDNESWESIEEQRIKTAPVIKIMGTGNYEGTITRHFQIHAIPITQVRLLSDRIICETKDSKKIEPKLELAAKLSGEKDYALKQDRDYSVSYHRITRDESGKITAVGLSDKVTDLRTEGEYLINIHGIGNFKGDMADSEDDISRCPILRVYSGNELSSDTNLNNAKLTRSLPVFDYRVDPADSIPAVLSKDAAALFAGGKIGVKIGSRELKYGTDYIIDDPADNDEEINRYPGYGNHIMLLPATGSNLSGSKRIGINIRGIEMKSVKLENFASSIEYTGKSIGNSSQSILNALAKSKGQPARLVTKDKKEVAFDAYSISIAGDTTAVGTMAVTFTGDPKHGCSGSITKKIKVTPKVLKKDELSISFLQDVDPDAVPYSKSGAAPKISVQITMPGGSKMTLKEGSDYRAVYSKNTKAGAKAAVGIEGKKNFKGSLKNVLNFTVCKKDLGTDITAKAEDKLYKAGAKKNYFKSVPAIYDGDKVLKLKKDYVYASGGEPSYTWANETKISGTTYAAGEVIDDNMTVPAGTDIRVSFAVEPAKNSDYDVTGDETKVSFSTIYRMSSESIAKADVKIADMEYRGEDVPVMPAKKDFNSIQLGGKALSGADYEIVSYDKNTKVGTAVCTIRGQGRYCGTKKCRFKIVKGRVKNAAADMPVDSAKVASGDLSAGEDSMIGSIDESGFKLNVAGNTFVSDVNIKATPVGKEELMSMGALEKGRFEHIISPADYKCTGYDGSSFGGGVELTLPLPDTDDIARYVFVYFDDNTGELRYLWPDRVDTANKTMTLALPHFSSWWGAKLSPEEQINAFLDNYCMQQAISQSNTKTSAKELEPYIRMKAEALGLEKQALADLVQAAANWASGKIGGSASGLYELGGKGATTLLRGVYDNDSGSIQSGMSDVADAALQKCWEELKYSERGMSVFKDSAIGGAIGNSNSLARMIANFSEGESGYEDGMKELGNILQSIHPAAELGTKGAKYLSSIANTSFVNWKASEVEELYRIYKNGGKDGQGNVILPANRETFLEYLNFARGITVANGIRRFYNMDKMNELYEKLKFTEYRGYKFENLPKNMRDSLEKYAEDGLMKYFETRLSQEKDADAIRVKEREIIETMLNKDYGALDPKHYNEFFNEHLRGGYDIEFRLERLINIREFLSQYVDEAELARGEALGGVNWGDLLNYWVQLASDKDYTRDKAIEEFMEYLKESNILKKEFDKVKVTGISVAPDSLELNTGSSATLTASVLPANASEQSITWTCSDSSVLSISSSGSGVRSRICSIEGVAAGDAIVTATSLDGGLSAMCYVTVRGSGGPQPKKKGLEQVFDEEGDLIEEYYYRDDGTLQWQKHYDKETGNLVWEAEYNDKEQEVLYKHYNPRLEMLEYVDKTEYREDGTLLKKTRSSYDLNNGGALDYEIEFTPVEEKIPVPPENDMDTDEQYIAKKTGYYAQNGETAADKAVVKYIEYALYGSIRMVPNYMYGYECDYFGEQWTSYYSDGTLMGTRSGEGTTWNEATWNYSDGSLKCREKVTGEQSGEVDYFWPNGSEKAVEYYKKNGQYGNYGTKDYFFFTGTDVLPGTDEPSFDSTWNFWHENGQKAMSMYGSFEKIASGDYSYALMRNDYNENGEIILYSVMTRDPETDTEKLMSEYRAAKGTIMYNYDSSRWGFVNPAFYSPVVEGYEWTSGHDFEIREITGGEYTQHKVWGTYVTSEIEETEEGSVEYEVWGYSYLDKLSTEQPKLIEIGRKIAEKK